MNVSIITPTYNSAKTIQSTLESVSKQTHPNIEHIIIDGGSTDETLDLVKKYGSRVTKVISEPDNGIYDAMNKGVALAQGEVVGILNSDDFYTHTMVVKRLMDTMEAAQSDSVYADLQYVDAEDAQRVVRFWKSGKFHPKKFLLGWMPPHPTFFVKRKIYESLGAFDAGFDISGDYELMLRFLFRHGVSTSYLPEVVVRMRNGGASNYGWKTRIKANKEDRLAWEMNDLEYKFYTPILKPVRKLEQYRHQLAGLF
ncbi:MAG: glycosyltransferase [Saprospiraceae bacterium]|nr:glycosyltransferase [Saprospiraceae bacterium]